MEPARKKILIIEDEEYLVRLIKSRLLINRFDVISASNGKEGLEKVENEKPDLVILDILLPAMNGIEFIAELKKRGLIPGLPVIAISAQPDNRELINDADIVDFVMKPFQPDDFISKVKRAVSRPPSRKVS